MDAIGERFKGIASYGITHKWDFYDLHSLDAFFQFKISPFELDQRYDYSPRDKTKKKTQKETEPQTAWLGGFLIGSRSFYQLTRRNCASSFFIGRFSPLSFYVTYHRMLSIFLSTEIVMEMS